MSLQCHFNQKHNLTFVHSEWSPSIRARNWRITVTDMWNSFPCFNARLLTCTQSGETGIPPIQFGDSNIFDGMIQKRPGIITTDESSGDDYDYVF